MLGTILIDSNFASLMNYPTLEDWDANMPK